MDPFHQEQDDWEDGDDNVFDPFDEMDHQLGGMWGLGPFPPSGGTATTTTTRGTGYGGDARSDQQQRKSGTKQAKKRETELWKEWQKDLKGFVVGCTSAVKKRNKQKESHAAAVKPPSTCLLNTVKQVLRWNAPDWWFKRPQKPLYVAALQVCLLLTQRFPELLLSQDAKPQDQDSPLRALQELAQTCQLLVKQMEKQQTNGKKREARKLPTVTQEWLKSQLSNRIKQAEAASSSALPAAVIQIYELAKKAVQGITPATLEPADECSVIDVEQLYRQNLRPLAFDTVEQWTQPLHYFSSSKGQSAMANKFAAFLSKTKKARKRGNPDNVKSKAAVLWKELSTYPTALPIEWGSSIYVRAVEHDMEQLRVLMIGPADTPYANGCFFFDVQLSDYPHSPPKVQFLTTRDVLDTNSTKVRFNPNLYADGQVCLSLLGTWQGPGWVSGESTLLQVLVSIQSLILGAEEPYYNEPGFESSQGTANGKKASDRYNETIRRETLRVALLPFWRLYGPGGTTARKPHAQGKSDKSDDAPDAAMMDVSDDKHSGDGKRKSPSPFCAKPQEAASKPADYVQYFVEFEAILRQHFQLKKADIEKQVRQWYEQDSSSAMRGLCEPFVSDLGPGKCAVRKEGSMDNDEDDDLRQALALSLLDSKPAAAAATSAKIGESSQASTVPLSFNNAALGNNESVWLAGDNSNEDLQKAIALSLLSASSLPSSAPTRSAPIVIDLIESDSDKDADPTQQGDGMELDVGLPSASGAVADSSYSQQKTNSTSTARA